MICTNEHPDRRHVELDETTGFTLTQGDHGMGLNAVFRAPPPPKPAEVGQFDAEAFAEYFGTFG